MSTFLLTTTHHLLAFDDAGRFFRVHSGKGLYYGLARHDGRIYVSCRNEVQGAVDGGARAEESGSILVLDSATLAPVDEFRPETFRLRDVHGIACFDGKLWVTCAFDNLVAICDLNTGCWTKWYPAVDPAERDRDVNHFNTIVPWGEQICVLAHNYGPSDLLFYDRCSLELCSALRLGCRAHDVFPVEGAVATCSSAEGLLVSRSGWTIRTGSFPRGIAYSDDGILVGLSSVAARAVRHQAHGIVRRYTSRWHWATDYMLPDVGMVLAILPIEFDARELAAMDAFEVKSFQDRSNPLEIGNTYRVGQDGVSITAQEWHRGEEDCRWTAAREARMSVIVNPGETALSVGGSSGFPGPYWAEVVLNGQVLGSMRWAQPGYASAKFTLPSEVRGSCEICFRVPHLWRPSACLDGEDQRMLGIKVHEVEIV